MDFNTLKEHINCYINEDQSSYQIKDNTTKLNRKEIKEYFKGISYPFKNEVEISTFLSFVNLLKEWGMSEALMSKYTDDFHYGYIIPQIGKEFDLIRFGENYNISIELKSSTTIEKQKKQLDRNSFYLNFLDIPTKYFSISPEIKSYLEFDSELDTFKEVTPSEFIKVLENQQVKILTKTEVDSLFNIKNYLVSPFNDVKKFLNQKYFLNKNQENIFKYILNPERNERLFTIKGNPGTGKTLLTYHSAKELIKHGFKVVIIHGARLNDGQVELNKNNFIIKPIKELQSILNNASFYDYIIIDEAQRLRNNQASLIVDAIRNNLNTNFIFSYDGKQTLDKSESDQTIDNILQNLPEESVKNFSLKDKVRTNQELNIFIKNLFKFPINQPIEKTSNLSRNIQIKYFSNKESADNYLREMQKSKEWEILNYSKSLFRKESLDSIPSCGKVSHDVIGQEFNKVIIPMDLNFWYQEETFDEKSFMILYGSNTYYPIIKMLYQNITRTREQLQIVVIENKDLYLKITNLLEQF